MNGWCSLYASDRRIILQKEGTRSKLMTKAMHAERARQTKILILKSITTLNDSTVTRILEKSDWNLRRAIEAFYIAKYKTQEYLKAKELAEAEAEANVVKNTDEMVESQTEVEQGGEEEEEEAELDVPRNNSNDDEEDGGGQQSKKKVKKVKKKGWWKSWASFTKNN